MKREINERVRLSFFFFEFVHTKIIFKTATTYHEHMDLKSSSSLYHESKLWYFIGSSVIVLLIFLVFLVIVCVQKQNKKKRKYAILERREPYCKDKDKDITSILFKNDEIPKNSADKLEDEENEDDQKSSYDLEANPQSVPQSEWVKYLTGMSEPELREGENIMDVIKAEGVPEYRTHRFTFVNKHTKVEHDAGYFYTESIGDMQEEFDKMPGDKGVPKGCKFIVDLRQDYVKQQ